MMSSALRTNDSAMRSAPSFSTRQVDALVVRYRSADNDLGRDDGTVGGDHLELHLAIVDEQGVSRLDVMGKALECGARDLLGAQDLLDCDLEDISDRELVGAVLEFAEPDLRALKIDEHCDGAPGVGARPADIGVDLLMHVVAAMAEVHAGDIHSGIHDGADVFIAGRCRPEGCNNFCASHVFLSVGEKFEKELSRS